jgi:hypothetical protein
VAAVIGYVLIASHPAEVERRMLAAGEGATAETPDHITTVKS